MQICRGLCIRHAEYVVLKWVQVNVNSDILNVTVKGWTSMKGVYVKVAHYLISEAAHLADVEPHVLRYWEEELELTIPRNELGHRYYTEKHIEMFKKIKAFKEKGYQLKAIRANLYGGKEETPIIAGEDGGILYISPEYEDLHKVKGYYDEDKHLENDCQMVIADEGSNLVEINDETSREVKMQEFRNIMTGIVCDAVAINNEKLAKDVTQEVSDRIIKEINYLAREQEERDEERFKRFDEVLRGYQRGSKAKAEAAAAKEDAKKNKRSKKVKKKNKAEKISVVSLD